MRALVCGLALFLLGTSAVLASPAKDASIRQLMAVTHVRAWSRVVNKRVDAMMDNAMRQSLDGRSPNPDEQKAIDRMRRSMHALMNHLIGWKYLGPIYLRWFKETYSEEEIQGMLAFYRSPVGQAVIAKRPLLLQEATEFTQAQMRASAPEMRQILAKFHHDVKAANND